MSVLDELFPTYDVRVVESLPVKQPPQVVDAALRDLRPDEVPAARWLLALRVGLRHDGEMLGRPLLEMAERARWVRLADEPGRELVLGIVGKARRPGFGVRSIFDRGEFERFNRLGYAKVALAYRFDPADQGARMAVELRVTTTDRRSGRWVRRYWRLGGLGVRWALRSSITSVKQRAERAPRPTEAAPPPHAAPSPGPA